MKPLSKQDNKYSEARDIMMNLSSHEGFKS